MAMMPMPRFSSEISPVIVPMKRASGESVRIVRVTGDVAEVITPPPESSRSVWAFPERTRRAFDETVTFVLK